MTPLETITGETSDGFHTMAELYHHRAVLFSIIVRDHRELAWKSMRHHDGTMYDGMFIVGIETPKGQATYHYDIDPYWDMFDCKELDRAPRWDGHTPDEAIARIATLGPGTCHLEEIEMDCETASEYMLNREWSFDAVYRCSCGCRFGHVAHNRPHYCPNCGAKVVRQ